MYKLYLGLKAKKETDISLVFLILQSLPLLYKRETLFWVLIWGWGGVVWGFYFWSSLLSFIPNHLALACLSPQFPNAVLTLSSSQTELLTVAKSISYFMTLLLLIPSL